MCAIYMPGAWRGHKKLLVWSPDTGIIDGCELLCGFWKSDPGPLDEQVKKLLTAKLPLQLF